MILEVGKSLEKSLKFLVWSKSSWATESAKNPQGYGAGFQSRLHNYLQDEIPINPVFRADYQKSPDLSGKFWRITWVHPTFASVPVFPTKVGNHLGAR